MEDLKYPIGKYEPVPFSEERRETYLSQIEWLPQQVEFAIENLDEEQLHTPYRPEGWTVHQLVHHIADSHMNAFIRFKLGLTENSPTIKPYEEQEWALLPDTKNLPVNISITLLHALHKRWCELLKNISAPEWERTVYHPASEKTMSLWYLLGMYAWHGKHHVAHITALRERMHW